MNISVKFNVDRPALIIAAGECLAYGDKPTKKNILAWLKLSYRAWGNGAALVELEDTWQPNANVKQSAGEHVNRLFPEFKEK